MQDSVRSAALPQRYISPGTVHKVEKDAMDEQAIRGFAVFLGSELEQAGSDGCRVLTLIHGYGSSGRGGIIRQDVRAQLQYLKDRGVINDLFPGEDFSSRSGSGRQLLRRFPFLRKHSDLNRANPGITLVVI